MQSVNISVERLPLPHDRSLGRPLRIVLTRLSAGSKRRLNRRIEILFKVNSENSDDDVLSKSSSN